MTPLRTALVTGAAQGIGRQIAVRLGSAGYRVLLADLREAGDAAEDVRDAGGEPVALTGDVTSEADVDAWRARAAEYGGVDVLVNNAGISFLRAAEDTEPEQWRRVVDVNLTGPFLTCRAFGTAMLSAGGGSIVNIASVAGLTGIADRAAYNATKHGLIGLTRTLAVEWGGRGVRVNAVCPGWVKTEMDEADQAGGGYTDDDITDHVPMGRFAMPGDIADAVAFLADPDVSGFVNGVALPVDGGWTADGSWQSLRLRKR